MNGNDIYWTTGNGTYYITDDAFSNYASFGDSGYYFGYNDGADVFSTMVGGLSGGDAYWQHQATDGTSNSDIENTVDPVGGASGNRWGFSTQLSLDAVDANDVNFYVGRANDGTVDHTGIVLSNTGNTANKLENSEIYMQFETTTNQFRLFDGDLIFDGAQVPSTVLAETSVMTWVGDGTDANPVISPSSSLGTWVKPELELNDVAIEAGIRTLTLNNTPASDYLELNALGLTTEDGDGDILSITPFSLDILTSIGRNNTIENGVYYSYDENDNITELGQGSLFIYNDVAPFDQIEISYSDINGPDLTTAVLGTYELNVDQAIAGKGGYKMQLNSGSGEIELHPTAVGTSTVVGDADGEQTIAVTFGTAMPDATYTITLGVEIALGAPTGSELIAYVILGKTSAGFTISLGEAIETGEEIDIHWSVEDN
jgi:hypothetical protein